MQTVIGFVVGYLVGSKEGKDGYARLKESWKAITTSKELRRLTEEAMSAALPALKRLTGGEVSDRIQRFVEGKAA